jgi:hypothetical protein
MPPVGSRLGRTIWMKTTSKRFLRVGSCPVRVASKTARTATFPVHAGMAPQSRDSYEVEG